MEDKHYTDLLIELECPVCTNYMTPPIRQCATGHSICEECRRKLPNCALCQGIFTESRNITLEGLAVKMRYPCTNQDAGCTLKLAYNEREVHESKCPFGGYKCAMEKCPWVGRYDDILAHWTSKKTSSKPYRQANVCFAKVKTESYFVNIVEAFNKLFWFKYKFSNKTLYWALQYIGKPDEAENYFYEVEIFKPNRPKRKVLVGDYCQSVNVENTVLFDDGCVSIPSDVVEPYIGEDQQFSYHFRVMVNKGGNKAAGEASGGAVPQSAERDRSKGPKGPQNPNKGPQNPNKGPQNPNKGPQNPNKNKDKKNFQGKNSKKSAEGFVVV